VTSHFSSALRRWFGDHVVAVVVAMVIVVPLLRFESSEHSVNRNVVLQLMGVLLLCTVLARVEWGRGAGERLQRFLCSGANLPALLFLAWAILSTFWVAPSSGVGRAFAMNDLLRLGTGVLVYLVVANHVENRRQLDVLVDAILLIVAVATLYRIFTPHAMPGSQPLIGGRLLLGAFLGLMLPVVAAVAAAPVHPRRQIAAKVVTVLTVVTLLATPTRSAWIGVLVGMGVFGALALRHLTAGVQRVWARRREAIYPLAALGGALVVVLLVSDLSPRVMARADTLRDAAAREDSSLNWRLNVWERALGAVAQRPVFGLGLGNYVLEQRAFTGHGQTAEEVTRMGASMDEQVHNEYLHIAVELGVPGLLLYLMLLFAFFAKSLHALERLPGGTRKTLLIGCIAAVTTQCVDAVSNPAWRASVCSLYLWLVLGLGTALVRMAYRGRAESSEGEVVRPMRVLSR
jgi:O-antigen ligase